MRLTVAHLREAAIIGGTSLTALAAMSATYLIAHDRLFVPGAISLIFGALVIFLIRRYEPRPQRPVDPRHRRIWFLSSLAAGGALAVSGLIAAVWIRGTYPEPGAPCPARSWTNAVPRNDEVSTNSPTLSPAEEEKNVGA